MPYGLRNDGNRDGPFQRAQDAMMARTVNAEAATAEAAFAPAAAQVPPWRQGSCMKQVLKQEQEPEVAGKTATATQVAGVLPPCTWCSLQLLPVLPLVCNQGCDRSVGMSVLLNIQCSHLLAPGAASQPECIVTSAGVTESVTSATSP